MMQGNDLTALYNRHFGTVWRVCLTLLRNPADTEDAVQSTFVQLMVHPKVFESDAHEKAWLIVTARNLCKSHLRAKRNTELSLTDTVVDERTVYIDETLTAVRALPYKYRTAIYLHYYEGYTAEEIAALLRCPSATVRSHLKRGRDLLRVSLGGSNHEG